MKIIDKMMKSYFHVAEEMNIDEQMTRCARCFHRTKKEAFFVEARRLDKDGYLAGEIKK
jgi:hypothetical protein